MKTYATLAILAMGIVTAQADLLVGLTVDNTLISFDSATPGAVTVHGAIGGLASGENMLGIDYRPKNGVLYGIGSTGSLFTISTTVGNVQATKFGQVMLNGTGIGFDFNPAADAIRITTDAGQNLRYRMSDGMLFNDTALNYANGDKPMVTASAYTNNDNDPMTGTTLYNVDAADNSLVIQNPPNAGTLTKVGSLGIAAGRVNGFDISGISKRAWLGVNTLDASGLTPDLYEVNLMTGATTHMGSIGGGAALRGLSAEPVPEPATMLALAGGAAALLRRRKKA
jgi:hypothetical protein